MRKLLILLPFCLAFSGCCACGIDVRKDDKVIEKVQTAQGTELRLKGDVSFDYRSSELKPEGAAAIDQLGQDLVKKDAQSLKVVGYTDSQGTMSFNMRLSLARAQAVKDRLVTQGVKAERIEAVGMGPNNPVAPNDTDESRAKNRRVEILVKE